MQNTCISQFLQWFLTWHCSCCGPPTAFQDVRIIFCASVLGVFLWPLAGRPEPPAPCAPLSDRRSSFSGALTWKEHCWSSSGPPEKTESWTSRSVKHKGKYNFSSRAKCGDDGCIFNLDGIQSTEYFYSMSEHDGISIPSVTNLYKLCHSLQGKYPAVTHVFISTWSVSMRDHMFH